MNDPYNFEELHPMVQINILLRSLVNVDDNQRKKIISQCFDIILTYGNNESYYEESLNKNYIKCFLSSYKKAIELSKTDPTTFRGYILKFENIIDKHNTFAQIINLKKAISSYVDM